MAELGQQFVAAAPANGLVIVAPNDLFAGSPDTMLHVGRQVHATSVTIEGAGHWWMCEQPQLEASMLIEHWNSVGR